MRRPNLVAVAERLAGAIPAIRLVLNFCRRSAPRLSRPVKRPGTGGYTDAACLAPPAPRGRDAVPDRLGRRRPPARAARPGVGLRSMEERASELGGTVRLERRSAGALACAPHCRPARGPNEHVSILVAGDHPMFVAGLRALLETDPDVHLVAVARTGEEAVELARRERPSIVLMDLQRPQLSSAKPPAGSSTSSQRSGCSSSPCSTTTSRSSPPCAPVPAATCSKTPTRTISCARSAQWRDGEAIFGPGIASRLIDYFAAGAGPAGGDLAARAFPSANDRSSG